MNGKKSVSAGRVSVLTITPASAANSKIDGGITGNNSWLDKIAKCLQLIVDFAGGPGVSLMVILSLIAGIGNWLFAPKRALFLI